MKLPGERCEFVSLNASCLRLRRGLQVTPIIVGYSKHLQYVFFPFYICKIQAAAPPHFHTHFVSLPISWIHFEEERRRKGKLYKGQSPFTLQQREVNGGKIPLWLENVSFRRLHFSQRNTANLAAPR